VVESQPSKLLVAGSIPVSRSRIVLNAMSFEQAAIKIEKVEEFGQLQRAVEEALSQEKVESFLKRLHRSRIRIRDFDGILVRKTLEATLHRADLSAKDLYGSLTLSDQAQMREFYLSKLETVDVNLRHRFKTLYQYY
jgi:hypothetical protein